MATPIMLLEIGNALARQRYRTAAVALLDALEADSNVEIVELPRDLCASNRFIPLPCGQGMGPD